MAPTRKTKTVTKAAKGLAAVRSATSATRRKVGKDTLPKEEEIVGEPYDVVENQDDQESKSSGTVRSTRNATKSKRGLGGSKLKSNTTKNTKDGSKLKVKVPEKVEAEVTVNEEVEKKSKSKSKKRSDQAIVDDIKPSKMSKSKLTDDNSLSLATIPRHLKSKKYVGAHTSISGGLYKAIEEAEEIGAVSIGMFLRSQRTWKAKELDDKSIKLFKEKLETSGILPSMIIPHGSYLLNCGSADEEILRKTRDCFVDELKRCELLGIPMYNFHPGSSKGSTPEACMRLISETINIAHEQTKSVITLIENMSCQGNTIGGDFNQLKSIIDNVKDKSRVGVCLDTCHAFAAGYDIKSKEGYEKGKEEFERIIGRKYLKAVHLNDSKGDLGCHLDRHENIGKGKLGLEFFARLMNDPFFDDVALVLETPECDYKKEIDLLYGLCR